MYDKCYFCLDQLPKLKKESTASFFVTFWRSRGTKEPAYITVVVTCEELVICPRSSRGARHIGTCPQGQGQDEE